MLALRVGAFAAALLGGARGLSEETPVQKVVTLLSDLKTQVETEGRAEAATYDEFACFCKETTTAKSTAITEGQDTIDSEAASIQADSAAEATKSTELLERKAKHEELANKLQETTVQCAKDKALLDAKLADLTKAASQLDDAISKLKAAKPTELLALRGTVGKKLAMTQALSLLNPKQQKAVAAFIQQGVDPNDPTYKFQSQQIIEALQTLQTDFTTQKAEEESELESLTGSCTQTKEGLNRELDTTNTAMETLGQDIAGLKETIADSRTTLSRAESLLKDDQVYLKELTQRCEKQAQLWDQRSSQRAGELQALSQALVILNGRVQDADAAVNARALLQKRGAGQAATAVHPPASFLQLRGHQAATPTHEKQSVVVEAHGEKAKVADFLQNAGVRLKSAALAALAAKVASDPFAKVKTLIQGLIERLLSESTAEASKKGFCDKEIGKATQERNFRNSDVSKINAELATLEAKKDALAEDIEELGTRIGETSHSLTEATELRITQKAENAETLKQAKEGLDAVKEAITILKTYYKEAGKATALVQESPVDADAPAALSGAYGGNQDAATGIIGILQVVQSDFQRTIRSTTGDEKAAAADFVKFDRTSKADMAGKETKRTLSEEDLVSSENAIKAGMADLQTAQNLVDAALQSIEDLKPMCIDTTMSYSDRAAKREEEIAALKQALCHLDPDGVESECQ